MSENDFGGEILRLVETIRLLTCDLDELALPPLRLSDAGIGRLQTLDLFRLELEVLGTEGAVHHATSLRSSSWKRSRSFITLVHIPTPRLIM